MIRHHPVRVLAPYGLFAVAVLGACSSSTSIVAGTTTAVTSPSTRVATTATSATPASSASTPASSASTSTTRASSATTVTTSVTAPTTTADAPGAATPFCTTLASMVAVASQRDGGSTAEAAMTLARDFYRELRRQSPAELVSDTEVLAALTARQYEIMARNGFDGDRIEADAEFAAVRSASQSSETQAAGRHVAAYGRDVCGLDMSVLTPPGG